MWYTALAPLAAAPNALHPIGRDPNAVGICGDVVVHANAAITDALADDRTLERLIERLRATDFEEASVNERNGLADVRRLSADLSETSARAASEVQRLRGYAARIDEDRQRAELSVFADALGSAIDRQHKMAIDLGPFLSLMAYREIKGDQSLPDAYATPLDMARMASGLAADERNGSPNTKARTTASDFDARLADVRHDELHAADLSEAAVGGC